MQTKQKRTKKQGTVPAKAGVTARRPIQGRTKVRQQLKHHAKKALVPHKNNQYRPHLIRLPGLAAVLVVAILAQVVYGYTTTGNLTVLGRVSDIDTVTLLAETNRERAAEGLGELQLNDKLSEAAFLRAQDMFTHNYWAHTSPSGVQPWKWLADVNYNYSYAGENLAKNYPDAEATVEAWMNSPSHKENVINTNYVDVGFAVVDGELNGQSTTLIVALYGSPATVSALQEVASQSTSFSASSVAVGSQRPFEYFGNALRSLSPVTIAILGIFAIIAIVGVAAHHYRKKLPKAWRQSWKVHHGMYTFTGVLVLGVLIIIATGGGSI